MVVRFVCVIRVPVCPECVPAPPRCLFTGLQSTGRNNRATRRGVPSPSGARDACGGGSARG